MIDIHTHLVRFSIKDEPVLDEKDLLCQMDSLGIEKAVLLPVCSPECFFYPTDVKTTLEVVQRHPDRFIPFCNLDPRSGANSPETDYSWVLEEYKAAGCKGVGELTANLFFDDPLVENLFHHCGNAGLPVLFHLADKIGYGLYGLADDAGLPRLERMLKQCPETTFIGHAMSFWSQISADVNEETRGLYPDGPVTPGGKLPELLKKYPNLYGDISAGSGFNAISRDPDFGYSFLEEYQDKLLFGTDICHVNQDVPIVPYINEALNNQKITKEAYQKITRKNTERLLGL